MGEEGQKPVGLCGSGIIDMIAELFRCGIINAKGLFVREGRRVKRDQHGTGRFILATPAESATGREISLTEVDIESFIRAKGAIYSAIDTLLSSMDMDASILEHVYVAGGIGSGINMKNAIFIGMFPAVGWRNTSTWATPPWPAPTPWRSPTRPTTRSPSWRGT